MKIVYTTDEHLTRSQPKNRTDNFLDSMLGKLHEICLFCQENEVDFWLSGGDFFHSSSQDCALVNPIISLFSDFQGEPWLPIQMIAGNHPIRGNYELCLEKSGLSTLESMGFVNINNDPCVFEIGGIKILLHHHTIVEKALPWDHQTFEDFSKENAGKYDLVMCSHYHAPQGVQTVNGMTFVSPGSLARGMGSEVNLDRPVQFAFIETGGKSKTKIQLIDVKCAPTNPFKEHALNDTISEKSTELVEFIREHLDNFEIASLEFTDLLDNLVKQGKVDPKVADYLRAEYEKLPPG